MRREWEKFRRESWSSRRLFLEAVLALAAARTASKWLPFRWLAGRLGESGAESPPHISPANDITASRIGWAVGAAARRLPWRRECLEQALAAYWMASRRGIGGTLYFGVAKDTATTIKAHAWVRCGTRLVTGARGHTRYRVVSCFARNEP